MFPQFIGTIEIHSKYITWEWEELTPHDLDTRIVTGIISIRHLN